MSIPPEVCDVPAAPASPKARIAPTAQLESDSRRNLHVGESLAAPVLSLQYGKRLFRRLPRIFVPYFDVAIVE